MKELRQIKLALIDSDFMTERVSDILSTLNETLGGLEQYKNYSYPNSIFYGRSENDLRIEHYYYQEELKNQTIYIQYSRVWSVFETKFNLNYIEIKSLISWYIERIYKLKVTHNTLQKNSLLGFFGKNIKLKK